MLSKEDLKWIGAGFLIFVMSLRILQFYGETAFLLCLPFGLLSFMIPAMEVEFQRIKLDNSA